MKNRVIALGFFDGLHLGHQALLRKCAERAAERNLTPALLTFDRSPREFVSGTPVPLLTTNAERCRAADALFPGIECLVVPFDRTMMTMPWENFVALMRNAYRADWLVAGHDFRFGFKNAGNVELLQAKAARLGMGCDIIPAVVMEGVTVSSTYIRELLERGSTEKAARFLGRPFAVSGPVRHGKHLGSSKLDAPTVNLVPDARQLVPAFGVYAAWVTVDGARRPAVTNVGVRPTVDTDGGVTIESHLLEPVGELYGADCRVEFLKMLRPEKRFGNLDELKFQIVRDAAAAKNYFAENQHT